jgi:hypothetical protein
VCGSGGYVLFLCAIYPSIGASPDIEDVIRNLPDAVKGFFGLGTVDLTSGSGFVDTELFSIVLPLIAIALGVGSRARIAARRSPAGSSSSSRIPCGAGARPSRREPRWVSSFSLV